MNQTQHDELAHLFSQNMQLAQSTQQHVQQVQQEAIIEHVPQETEKQAELPVHFVSTHYTGTAHVRPDTISDPPPPYHEALMSEAMAEILRQHSIDPSALLPNQVHLFQNADYEQRSRLLELWRIAPPSYPLEEHLNGTWISTSVEREEALAKIRYEQQQQQEVAPAPPQHEEHMLDTHIPLALQIPGPLQIPQSNSPAREEESTPISPIREFGEAAWPPAARMRASWIAGLSRPQTRHGEAEPYIVNGYQEDQTTRAVDPVYAAAAGLWQAPSYAQAIEQQTSMEEQYGMYEQIRNHADWERMNEQTAREKLGQQHVPLEDYDMEL